MLLLYADDAKLFVPVERLDLVSRYSSGEATAPDARPTRRARLAKDEGEGQARDARHGGRAFAALCRAKACPGPRLLARRAVAA